MSIALISELQPKNNGQFALLDDAYLRGGFHIVDNLTTRNSISVDRRKSKMRVAVQSTDMVYILQDDLVSWIVDQSTTVDLQAAYNRGAEIVTTNPVILTGSDIISQIFLIRNLTTDILKVTADNVVEFGQTIRGKDYTTSINATIITDSVNTVLDNSDKRIYRAIQYCYTVQNSDNSGYETGQLFLIHNGNSATLYSVQGNNIDVSCGIAFSCQINGYNLQLMATTDNSILASRIVHLFKISLT